MKDYSTAFTNADHVIITKVYSAREKNIWNCSGEDLANMIGGTSTEYIHELEDVIEKLALAISLDNDQETIVFTLGEGDITILGPQLLRRFAQSEENLTKCR
ncbi:hypothetical protein Cni_G05860 [Canna indica]|uniref:Uncharacterized protein n=1 Tax=Canna indica TaxID=4628 RepID=A0AAQ3JVY3_9LILI|nr:hypothetical protein Cni_G05860 [Canna indica]